MRIVLIVTCFLLSCSAVQKGTSSLNDSGTALGPCPASPNCVSSTAVKNKQLMPAMVFHAPLPIALQQLDSVVQSFSNATLVYQSDYYLQYTFRTKLGGFTDDVEFLFDTVDKKIHFRSASRKGWSDMGANKRRMNKIINQWKALH